MYPEQLTEEVRKKLRDRDVNWILNSNRLKKVKDNIKHFLLEPIKYPFVCYTFGADNHIYLQSLGIESRLVNKDPNPFHMYRHKIEAWVHGMKDFDEIVFTDWDTIPIKSPDDRFWELLKNKDIIQASLGRYKTARLNHRDPEKHNNFNPSGSFVYMRDKSLPEQIIEIWKTSPNMWSEEPSLAILIDKLMGKWNFEEYGNRFEPVVYKKDRTNMYKKEEQNIYFRNRCHPWRY